MSRRRSSSGSSGGGSGGIAKVSFGTQEYTGVQHLRFEGRVTNFTYNENTKTVTVDIASDIILTSPQGYRFRLRVTDAGVLITELV